MTMASDQPESQNANTMPGGTTHTAGGKVPDAGVVDALKTVRLADAREIHQKPCVREALLTGIGSGFAVGSVRAVVGGKGCCVLYKLMVASVMTSCNWAVGTFCMASFLMHEFCQRKRLLEKQGMKRAIEVMDRKQAERQQALSAAREARRNGE